MILEKYLETLNKEDVGGFAIDSFPNPAHNKPLEVGYPGSDDEDNELKESIVFNDYDIDGKRIMIDFDQTIHKYSVGWIDDIIYDEPIGGAKEVIKQLRSDGHQVIIFTSRLSETANGKEGAIKQKGMIESWLKKYGIEVDGITAEKLPAEVYIDDRGLHFNGQWDKELYQEIKLRLEKN